MKKIYFLIFIFIFISCEKKEIRIDNWKKFPYRGMHINYEHGKINFFNGRMIPENYMRGSIRMENERVIFLSDDMKTSFTLFDFHLKEKECIDIAYDKREHLLCVDDIFYYKTIKDTVYKFQSAYVEASARNFGIVFFVNKKIGIMGHYYTINDPENGKMVSDRMYGNVFSEKYDYDMYERFLLH